MYNKKLQGTHQASPFFAEEQKRQKNGPTCCAHELGVMS